MNEILLPLIFFILYITEVKAADYILYQGAFDPTVSSKASEIAATYGIINVDPINNVFNFADNIELSGMGINFASVDNLFIYFNNALQLESWSYDVPTVNMVVFNDDTNIAWFKPTLYSSIKHLSLVNVKTTLYCANGITTINFESVTIIGDSVSFSVGSFFLMSTKVYTIGRFSNSDEVGGMTILTTGIILCGIPFPIIDFTSLKILVDRVRGPGVMVFGTFTLAISNIVVGKTINIMSGICVLLISYNTFLGDTTFNAPININFITGIDNPIIFSVPQKLPTNLYVNAKKNFDDVYYQFRIPLNTDIYLFDLLTTPTAPINTICHVFNPINGKPLDEYFQTILQNVHYEKKVNIYITSCIGGSLTNFVNKDFFNRVVFKGNSKESIFTVSCDALVSVSTFTSIQIIACTVGFSTSLNVDINVDFVKLESDSTVKCTGGYLSAKSLETNLDYYSINFGGSVKAKELVMVSLLPKDLEITYLSDSWSILYDDPVALPVFNQYSSPNIQFEKAFYKFEAGLLNSQRTVFLKLEEKTITEIKGQNFIISNDLPIAMAEKSLFENEEKLTENYISFIKQQSLKSKLTANEKVMIKLEGDNWEGNSLTNNSLTLIGAKAADVFDISTLPNGMIIHENDTGKEIIRSTPTVVVTTTTTTTTAATATTKVESNDDVIEDDDPDDDFIFEDPVFSKGSSSQSGNGNNNNDSGEGGNNNNNEKKNEPILGPNSGIVIGCVVGAIVIFTVVGAMAIYMLKRKKARIIGMNEDPTL